MTTRVSYMALWVLAILLMASTSFAEIKKLEIKSDSRAMILFEKFGFTHTGHVTISVSSVSVSSENGAAAVDSDRLGFFLLSEESLLQVAMEIQQNPRSCVLDSNYVLKLFTLRSLSPPPVSSFNQSFPVTHPNEYSLFFANCAPPPAAVSMSVRTEIYNLDSGSGKKDYLPAGLTQLPALFSAFAVAYVVFLVVWARILVQARPNSQRIHLLMAALLLMKALNLMCAAEDKHYVKVTGTAHGWEVVFYIFQGMRVVLLFTVIVLVGTGWSLVRPFLQEREKKVLMAVVPLQVVANVAAVVIGETGPFIRDWVTWNQVFLFVDVACCCAIIFPIVWSIRTLRETSKTDGKAARNLAKLTLFRRFYVLVIGYLYFTRIVVFALRTISAYKFRWVANAAEELASLAFYLLMFYMFRPAPDNHYLHLDDEDHEEEEAEQALKDDDFDL